MRREDVVRMLNKIYDADPVAMQLLVDHRVHFGECLLTAEGLDQVIVGGHEGHTTLGVLGIVSGMLEIGAKPIFAKYSGTEDEQLGDLLGFE